MSSERLIPLEPNLSREERVALTWSVLRVLDAWSLPAKVQLDLLGLGGTLSVGQLGHFRLGTPLPAECEVYQRAQLLLHLEQALGQIFPHSALAAKLWITTPSPKLGQATPLDTLLGGDLETLRRLAASLDNLPLY